MQLVKLDYQGEGMRVFVVDMKNQLYIEHGNPENAVSFCEVDAGIEEVLRDFSVSDAEATTIIDATLKRKEQVTP